MAFPHGILIMRKFFFLFIVALVRDGSPPAKLTMKTKRGIPVSYKISGFSDEIASDIQTQFTVLRRLGISHFEPRGINGKNISTLTDDELSSLLAAMKQHGIAASSIGSPVGKVKLSEDFGEHFAMFRRVVDIAERLGARYIRMFSFYHDGDAPWTHGERTAVIARLSEMIAYAREHDVILLHENEKDVYGDTVERCVDLQKELSCPHFRAVFDPANFVQCGEDPLAAYKAMRPYIAYMHIKDARADDGRVVPAGQGDGKIPEILSDLYAGGYDGFLSLEPHLGSFEGLADLELSDEMLKLPKGGEGTFTLAYQSLQSILP